MENIGYKFRIYPNEKQKEFINKQIGACRFFYNTLLDRRFTIYDKAKNLPEEQRKKIKYPSYSSYTKKYTWIKEIDTVALCYEERHLQSAFRNWTNKFNPKKPEENKPKFKKKGIKNTYTTKGTNLKIIDNKLYLPKFKSANIEPIKIIVHRPIPGRIVSGTIIKKPSGRYYISLIIEVENKRKQLPNTNSIIGIDLGIKQYLTYAKANGEVGKIENPKHYKKLQQRIAFYNKELSRRKLGSQNWKKTKQKLAKTYEKLVDTRNDFLNKLTNKIIKENDVVIIEDLKVKEIISQTNKESTCNRQKHNINKATLDVGWYSFRQMLEYKAKWYGRYLKIVDKDYKSTELCNKCGYIEEKLKDVTIREWTCPNCKTYHDRDINACYNLIRYKQKPIKVI